jgi:hypothetical protein
MFKPTPELIDIIRRSGSQNRAESLAATAELAKALETPLREAVLDGDILSGIFEPMPLLDNTTAEFPLDIVAPGAEKEFVAYTIPNQGRIPERHVEGDYVQVPIYDYGASIDWLLKFARDANWMVMRRIMQVMQYQFTKKLNDDGWHTLISAAFDRNIVVLDSDASAGQFTKRLVSLAKTVMRRNGGGNSTSTNRGQLTDLYMSPEAHEDILNWGVDQIDELTRREIYVTDSDRINRIFGVNLHVLDELGEGQEYQLFYTNTLGGTVPSGDVEMLVGLDLRRNDSFIHPIREEVQIFEDETLHRQKRAGLYGWGSGGFACLDSRRSILLSI